MYCILVSFCIVISLRNDVKINCTNIVSTFYYKIVCRPKLVWILCNANLSGIQKLQMSENNITVLSGGTYHFDKLSGIKEIDLSCNSLCELPDELFNYPALVNLEKLILDYNEISLLKSDQFSVLSGLKYLQIIYNKIQIVEPEAFTSISNSSLQSVDLRDNEIGLNELPEVLPANLTHLIELQLPNN